MFRSFSNKNRKAIETVPIDFKIKDQSSNGVKPNVETPSLPLSTNSKDEHSVVLILDKRYCGGNQDHKSFSQFKRSLHDIDDGSLSLGNQARDLIEERSGYEVLEVVPEHFLKSILQEKVHEVENNSKRRRRNLLKSCQHFLSLSYDKINTKILKLVALKSASLQLSIHNDQSTLSRNLQTVHVFTRDLKDEKLSSEEGTKQEHTILVEKGIKVKGCYGNQQIIYEKSYDIPSLLSSSFHESASGKWGNESVSSHHEGYFCSADRRAQCFTENEDSVLIETKNDFGHVSKIFHESGRSDDSIDIPRIISLEKYSPESISMIGSGTTSTGTSTCSLDDDDDEDEEEEEESFASNMETGSSVFEDPMMKPNAVGTKSEININQASSSPHYRLHASQSVSFADSDSDTSSESAARSIHVLIRSLAKATLVKGERY